MGLQASPHTSLEVPGVSKGPQAHIPGPSFSLVGHLGRKHGCPSAPPGPCEACLSLPGTGKRRTIPGCSCRWGSGRRHLGVAVSELAPGVVGAAASLYAHHQALPPCPAPPSLPAGGDLRKMGPGRPLTPGPALASCDPICYQSVRLYSQQSPSISKAIFPYLRQKELSVGGQIISLISPVTELKWQEVFHS